MEQEHHLRIDRQYEGYELKLDASDAIRGPIFNTSVLTNFDQCYTYANYVHRDYFSWSMTYQQLPFVINYQAFDHTKYTWEIIPGVNSIQECFKDTIRQDKTSIFNWKGKCNIGASIDETEATIQRVVLALFLAEATRLGDIVGQSAHGDNIVYPCGEIAARGMQPSRNAKISKKSAYI